VLVVLIARWVSGPTRRPTKQQIDAEIIKHARAAKDLG
jgi:hypothetical protein